MADHVEKTTQVVESAGTAADKQRSVTQASETTVGGTALVARVIWFITGVLLVLLAFRFLLTLLGANPANAFADFIYSASHPFVAPFFGLFGYNLQYGVSRFEIYTLVAMVVYAIVAWGLARLVTLNKPQPE